MERARQAVGPASSQWEFHAWHECQAEDDPRLHADRHATLLWLRQFRQDPTAMAGLRSVLHAHSPFTLPLGHSSDEQVFAALSRLLSSGVLHVHRVAPPATNFPGAGRETAPAEAAPAARRPAQSSTAATSPAAAEEANTFSSATDAAATAAVLRSASESGVPFCEECAKAAAAAAARQAA